MICHKVQEALPDAYTLIVRKHYKAMDSVVLDLHMNVHDGHKSDRLVMVNHTVASGVTS